MPMMNVSIPAPEIDLFQTLTNIAFYDLFN